MTTHLLALKYRGVINVASMRSFTSVGALVAHLQTRPLKSWRSHVAWRVYPDRDAETLTPTQMKIVGLR